MGLEQHGHVRAQPAAVMATRWSRAHGELYLRRKWNDGGVKDVEELTLVLWFRGIGPRCSVEGDFGSVATTDSQPPCSRRKEMAGVKWRGERRVNEALAFIWGTDTRCGGTSRACTPRGDQLLGRSTMACSVGFLKRTESTPDDTTDSVISTIHNSQTVAIWFMV